MVNNYFSYKKTLMVIGESSYILSSIETFEDTRNYLDGIW